MAIQLTSNAAATGATATAANNAAGGASIPSTHICQVSFGTSPGFTAISVRLEMALNYPSTLQPGSSGTWVAMAPTYAANANDLAAGFCAFSISGVPAEWVRANITTYTPASGTPAVTILYSPARS